MAGVQFGVPGGGARRSSRSGGFFGVDFTSPPGNVSDGKSPDAPNMIRDVPGKVRKCMGYHLLRRYCDETGAPLPINGYHAPVGETEGLVHAGTRIYRGDTLLYEGAGNARSHSWQLSMAGKNHEAADGESGASGESAQTEEGGGSKDQTDSAGTAGQRLILQDGKALLVYDGETVKTAASVGYIPTLTIGKSPAGGGEEYEALNLLQPAFIELFCATADAKTFQLTFGGLDAAPVKAFVMNAAGGWDEKTEDTDFSVNRQTGAVTFVSPPGASPITGEDNVKIEASRTVPGYADRINHCRVGILFGVSGNADRLFVSGNPDEGFCSYDWYSGQNDPTYWPDLGYATVGSGASGVVGYAIVDNYLAAFKDWREPDRQVVVRKGDLLDNEPAFPVVNTMQGPGAIAPDSFAYLDSEPLFLTRLGVYALTTSDISGSRYSQNRSYYLDGKLRQELGLADAFGFVHNDLYWLCLNGAAYILDGLQPLTDNRSAPYSTRQYAGFYRTNLPARVMWESDGHFCFGGADGGVYAFYEDAAAPGSYNDDGQPITAFWTTPYLAGEQFFKKKYFRMLALSVSAMPVTSCTIQMLARGGWKTVKAESARTRFFSWPYLVWNKWSWNRDATPHTLTAKARLKRADKTQFRFVNAELNEPFGLLQFACEYTQGSNERG